MTVSKTTPTLQVVVVPPLRRGSPIHDRVFQALRELGAEYVRYVPWTPYPKLGVAELDAPHDGKTSWDFSLIDPMTEDFINAAAGHPVIMNFSTIPEWMFKTDKPVPYPADPDQPTWDYDQGTEIRDANFKDVADYYARLVSWYTRGGFTDEYGKRHESGHHYKIDYWEVLNEINREHRMTPETNTRAYDAIVEAVHRVDPKIKFVGLVLGHPPSGSYRYFEYFLNRKNHQPGVPMDMISYHFYAVPTPDQALETMQYTYWEQANRFLSEVEYIQNIRARLSPETQTTIDELGSISADDLLQGQPGYVAKPIANAYWNLCGALYAYLYAELARRGVEVAAESQLVGYPTQFPSVSMVDWNTGQPNARFWVLKLLHDNFAPGDKLVETHWDSPYIYAQAFVTREGQRKLLLVNRRSRTFQISIPAAQNSGVSYVDQSTAFQPPVTAHWGEGPLTLSGFEVAVVKLPE